MTDKTKGIIQLVLVIVFILASFIISSMLRSEPISSQKAGGQSREIFVETVTATPENYRIKFNTTGSVQARANINITPQIQGRIVKINDNLFEGANFKAGEVLFQVDPRDFELEVRQLRATVAQAQTALNIEQAQGDAALMDWKQLNGEKPVPDLVARKPQLKEARANLQAARAQLDNAQLALERTKFSFPFDGRVLSSTLEKGQFVAAGQSYGQVFDLSTLEAQASLEDKQLKWLTNSDDPKIKITANYLGQTKIYDGFLKRTAGSLDQETRFARVSFGFKAEEQNLDLLPGVFVDIEIEGSELENVSILPAIALQKEGNIWIVDENNTLQSIMPDIIYGTDKNIIVSNLPQNTQIVTSRVSGATEGMKVQINNETQSGDNEINRSSSLTSLEIPSK